MIRNRAGKGELKPRSKQGRGGSGLVSSRKGACAAKPLWDLNLASDEDTVKLGYFRKITGTFVGI